MVLPINPALNHLLPRWRDPQPSVTPTSPRRRTVHTKLSMSFDSLNSSHLRSTTTPVPRPHQPGLSRPPASSHDKVRRIRGGGIPAEKRLHPRTLMSQHDPHAARLNLEQQQAARIHLAVSLRALLAPPPPTIRSRTAMDLWLRRPRVRRGITRSSSGPAARRGPHGRWGPARWASP